MIGAFGIVEKGRCGCADFLDRGTDGRCCALYRRFNIARQFLHDLAFFLDRASFILQALFFSGLKAFGVLAEHLNRIGHLAHLILAGGIGNRDVGFAFGNFAHDMGQFFDRRPDQACDDKTDHRHGDGCRHSRDNCLILCRTANCHGRTARTVHSKLCGSAQLGKNIHQCFIVGLCRPGKAERPGIVDVEHAKDLIDLAEVTIKAFLRINRHLTARFRETFVFKQRHKGLTRFFDLGFKILGNGFHSVAFNTGG